MKKHTKIVATIGPATESKEMLEKLVKAGLNVMRLNFSHGDFAEHQNRVNNLRSVSKKLNTPVAILQDLSGPKIRIGEFETERVDLKVGKKITIVTGKKFVGTDKKVWVNYPTLHKELKKGSIVFLDDGKKKLVVEHIKGNEINCKILVGGNTKGRRGVNLPGAYLKTSSLTPKDRKDLEFGIENKVDYFALSFVRQAKDVLELKEILKKAKCDAHIIAKIETEEAIENLEDIISVADGVMIARGDLAIEVPAEKVPVYQKRMIELCRHANKPVITATQMLESMINSPVPTRAEVSDVANAIFDGTDAVMLSEETTLGQFPVEAVSVMARVADEVESNGRMYFKNGHENVTLYDELAQSALRIAKSIDAKAIVAITDSGFSARALSSRRPEQFIIAVTSNQKTEAQLALSFGCIPLHIKGKHTFELVLSRVKQYIKAEKLAKKGDNIVFMFGEPVGKKGTTANAISVQIL